MPSDPTPSQNPPKPSQNTPESQSAPAEPIKSTPEATKTAPTKPQKPFAWDDFLETIRQDHDAIYLQLQKTEHEFDGQTLQIYPSNKFAERVLKKAENSRVLTETLNGIELIIHSVDDRAAPKDATISQISAIMGNVKEIDADMPF